MTTNKQGNGFVNYVFYKRDLPTAELRRKCSNQVTEIANVDLSRFINVVVCTVEMLVFVDDYVV